MPRAACGQQARLRVSALIRARRVEEQALVQHAKSSSHDVRGLLRGHSSTEQVAQMREDVRAIVALRLVKHELTRMKEDFAFICRAVTTW